MAMPRLKEQYRNEVIPAMMETFEYSNRFQTPAVSKIVVNVGAG